MANNSSKRWKLGAVSYLNAKPLVAGLDSDPSVELHFDVPSRLPALLDQGVADAALVPVIDLAEPGRNWRVISDACIGCDGETFTVRVFSRCPPEMIHTLHVDGDSHTSVMLARVIWRHLYGRSLTIVPFNSQKELGEYEAVLLIGDKVVTFNSVDLDIQTDLGRAWKSLTLLPFVFAVWAARSSGTSTKAGAGADTDKLAELLARSRDLGVRSVDMIAEDYGPGMGWPVNLAKRYLKYRLKFKMDDRYHQAMAKFFELARMEDASQLSNSELTVA